MFSQPGMNDYYPMRLVVIFQYLKFLSLFCNLILPIIQKGILTESVVQKTGFWSREAGFVESVLLYEL